MNRKIIVAGAIIIPLLIVSGLLFYASTLDIAVLNPAGEIASRQHELLSFAFWLSMLIIVPVFLLVIFIMTRYRAGNKKATYRPNWGHSRGLEAIWWGIPILIILILSAVTWRTSHTLDPYKPLDNAKKPIEVQVVAMQWKWLFLYPEQNIASVNYLKIPTNTPINFKITSDAPMNSFWIPKLGGQVYAMSGMSTKLHLLADEVGEYEGRSANISGEGFANMHFITSAVEPAAFNTWTDQAQYIGSDLTQETYDTLSQPGPQDNALVFSGFKPGLYDTIINKYMSHSKQNTEHQGQKAH